MGNFFTGEVSFGWVVPEALEPGKLRPVWRARCRTSGETDQISVFGDRVYVTDVLTRNCGFDCFDLNSGKLLWGFRISEVDPGFEGDIDSFWFHDGRFYCAFRWKRSWILEFDSNGGRRTVMERDGYVHLAKAGERLILAEGTNLEVLDARSYKSLYASDLPADSDFFQPILVNHRLGVTRCSTKDRVFTLFIKWTDEPTILKKIEQPDSDFISFSEGVVTDRWLIGRQKPGSGSHLHVWDAESLEPRHVLEMGDGAGTNVILEGDTLYVTAVSRPAPYPAPAQSQLRAYDLVSGKTLWHIPVGSCSYMIGSRDWIYRGGEKQIGANRRSNGEAASVEMGKCKWPVFLAIADGKLLCTTRSGKEIWCFAES